VTGVVYLGGGGSGQDERLLWNEMLRDCRRLLYWPFALGIDKLAGAEAWLRDQVHRQGSSADVQTWTTLDGKEPVELQGFDLLFVGGGNTFSLLNQMQEHGFVAPVRKWVEVGGNYYGGSAGAILATDSIAVAAQSDPNDVGLLDLDGLGLLRGVDLLPHYTPDQEEQARSLSRDHGVPVIAVPEAAGLVVEQGQARTVGPEAVWTIDSGTATRHAPGSLLHLPGATDGPVSPVSSGVRDEATPIG
jgi:dipeptidase E